MNRNLRALLLIVLVAVIAGVLLGVFLSGGDEESEAPATVASVESESTPPVAEATPAEVAKAEGVKPESAEAKSAKPASVEAEGVKPESTEAESAKPASVAAESAAPESVEARSVGSESVKQEAPAKTDQPLTARRESSVVRAAPGDEAEVAHEVPAPEGQVRPPTFDVVRVSPSGRAVIAGRAEPGSEVTVLEDGVPLGSALADKRGEWVLVPEKRLEGGDRELSLVQDMPNGDRVVSEQIVVLSVPVPRSKPAVAVAEAESEMARTEPAEGAARAPEGVEEKTEEAVIAVLVERDGDGPSRVLQSPDVGGEGIGDEAEVTIRSVDYDSEGEVKLAGRTEPNATVNVYVDEKYIGSAKASEKGDWQLSPEEQIPPGQHRLRIDKVDEEGFVLARIETPFSRARPEELLWGDALVVVQPGNSLWRIARRAYGGGIFYTEIYGANRAQILDPEMIFPGQILTLPVLN